MSITKMPVSSSNAVGFLQSLPPNYDPAKKYPLIIFLHGVGGRGSGTDTALNILVSGELPIELQQGVQQTWTVAGVPSDFILLAPQTGSNWSLAHVDAMLNYAKINLPIDWECTTLTGLSLGGGFVWAYGNSSLANAQKFAVYIPVCGTNGSTNFNNLAQANAAIWAFHATDDPTVSVNSTHIAISGINGNIPAPLVPAQKTIYPTGGHAIWGRVYNKNNTPGPGIDGETVSLYEYILMNKIGKPVPIPRLTTSNPTANLGGNKTVSGNTLLIDISQSLNVDYTKWDACFYEFKKYPLGGYGVAFKQTATDSGGAYSNQKQRTLINLGIGDYELQVTVKNAYNKTSTDTIIITVTGTTTPPINQKPVSNAGSDQTINLSAAIIQLDGSGTDPDGNIVSYKWKQLSGPNVAIITNDTIPKPTVTGIQAGTYVFELMITDNNGATNSDTVSIVVLPSIIKKRIIGCKVDTNLETFVSISYNDGTQTIVE